MPITDFQSGRKCKRCGSELPAGALACDQCNALTHASELEVLAANAKQLESQGEYRLAREQWAKALGLLPPASKQCEWIRDHIHDLESIADTHPPEPQHKWVKRLGPIGPIVLLLLKGKGLFVLFNAKFILSFFAFFSIYWSLYGATFGIGLAVLILIHEMGHFIDIKRRGLPADMPVFLPGFGAYVRWQALGVSAGTRASVSLAGPLAGLLAAICCALLGWATGNVMWSALARFSAGLNLLNLIPVWMLDGGQAIRVLDKAERIALVSACVILALVAHESMFLLVAGGATYRLFTRDMPEHPSRATTIYFIVILTLLAITMRLLPGHGLGKF